MPVYVKELAMHISRLPRAWIRKAYLHVLTPALEALSLADIWYVNSNNSSFYQITFIFTYKHQINE